MNDINLQKQSGQPLFPKVLWSKPVSRAHSGRLLIVGGQAKAFHHTQALHQIATACGVGECRLVMPDSLRRTLSEIPDATFVPSSPSGSIGKAALATILELATESDTTLIAGNLTTNSETAIVIESFLQQTDQLVVIGDEVVDIMKFNPNAISQREKVVAVLSMAATMRLANSLMVPLRASASGGVVAKVDLATQLQAHLTSQLVAYSSEIIIPMPDGAIFSPLRTSLGQTSPQAEATLAVFAMQNPSMLGEALATGAYILQESIQPEQTVGQASAAIHQVLARFD